MIFGLLEYSIEEKVKRLTEDALSFQALVKAAADAEGITKELIVEELYAYPISYINEMIVNAIGENDDSIALRQGLQFYVGTECFGFHYANSKEELGGKKYEKFLERFVDISNQQCKSHIVLAKSMEILSRTEGDEDVLQRCLYATLKRFFSEDVPDEKINSLLPWFIRMWRGWHKITEPFIEKHCIKKASGKSQKDKEYNTNVILKLSQTLYFAMIRIFKLTRNESNKLSAYGLQVMQKKHRKREFQWGLAGAIIGVIGAVLLVNMGLIEGPGNLIRETFSNVDHPQSYIRSVGGLLFLKIFFIYGGFCGLIGIVIAIIVNRLEKLG